MSLDPLTAALDAGKTILNKMAIEADAWCDRYYFGELSYQHEWEKKFAELIVRECANIVRNSSMPDAYSEACLEYIADEIKEHFGVE